MYAKKKNDYINFKKLKINFDLNKSLFHNFIIYTEIRLVNFIIGSKVCQKDSD